MFPIKKNNFLFLSLVLNLLALKKIGDIKGKKRTLFSILIYVLPILNLDLILISSFCYIFSFPCILTATKGSGHLA